MLEQLKRNIALIVVVAAFLIIVYVAYQNYDRMQRCGNRPCPDELLEGFRQRSLNFGKCTDGVCAFDLEREWAISSCSIKIQNSLVYRVDILHSPDGLVANFSCEFGPMYNPVISTFTKLEIIKNCSWENVEAMDAAIRGRNTTPVPKVVLMQILPSYFHNYSYNVLACDKYASGPLSGRYVMLTFVNYSGLVYG